MTDQHPITPPPERFKQWEDDILNDRENVDVVLDCAWKDGFRAGADQELEAFIKYFHNYDTSWGENSELITGLRAARRPNPPSLKEQALGAMGRFTVNAHINADEINRDFDTIRRALEQLDG